MDICTAKPESGLTLASDNRSVERTKKLPWNVWMDSPVDEKDMSKIGKDNKHYDQHMVSALNSMKFGKHGVRFFIFIFPITLQKTLANISLFLQSMQHRHQGYIADTL